VGIFGRPDGQLFGVVLEKFLYIDMYYVFVFTNRRKGTLCESKQIKCYLTFK
jgi:hypothetical protein